MKSGFSDTRDAAGLPRQPASSAGGFTIIELSIVLVIIGLILGGVFVGRNLIQAADMRAVISQIERYKTAVNTFKLKYNALPGDMPNASDYWSLDANCGSGNAHSTTSVCNGDGDGKIGSITQWPTHYGEVYGVWNQLALAELIPGGYIAGSACGYGNYVSPLPGCSGLPANIPLSYNVSGVVLMYGDIDFAGTKAGTTNGKHVFIIGQANASNWPSFSPLGVSVSQNAQGRAFTSFQAYWIDSKLDDGLPYSGSVMATWDSVDNYCGKSQSGKNVYLMHNTFAQGWPQLPDGCALYFIAGF